MLESGEIGLNIKRKKEEMMKISRNKQNVSGKTRKQVVDRKKG